MSNQLFEEIETVEDVTDNITPEKLAYYLAYEATEYGTELLDLLLYYRNLGRI